MRQQKKFNILWMIIIVSFIAIACDNTSITTPSTTSDEITSSITSTTTYENTTNVVNNGYLTYYTWSHDGKNIMPNKYADIHFTNVTYTPSNKKLCFDISVSDLSYSSSDYYLITRERGSTLTESQIKFNINSTSQTLHECMGYSVADEIVVIKDNSEDLNPSSAFEVMALVKVDDQMAEYRKYPDDGGYFTSNYVTSISAEVGTPYIDFKYHLVDSERLIESIYIEVYYREFDLVVAAKEIEFTEAMYQNDVIHFDHIVIDGLSPNTEFEVFLYCSGTDGVEEYEYLYWASRNATSSGIISESMIVSARPSLWGTIFNFEVGDTTTEFDYYLDNDGVVKYQDAPLDVVLRIYDNLNHKVAEYPMESGTNTVQVDKTYLKEYYTIKIETVQTPIILSSLYISYGVHGCLDYFSYQNKIFRFILNPTNVDIISLYISLNNKATGTPFFEKTITNPEQGWFNLPVSSSIVSSNDLYITYTVTYYGFSGIETFTLSPHVTYGG
ncbi:MAG: hypothetical protein CVV56_08470 [Tenericutes bacterium HGW-Tenericutes-1]|jgi:hypothetical protein|nr:MAG: hypothetical protein CVV58_00035 [Tenericutes bacterium HGW-Tenericutes-3]PKK99976.1 MAG: hypothetical protein CVV56_08470 [Tenericutes bacterium HGW-Tenericutes-1]